MDCCLRGTSFWHSSSLAREKSSTNGDDEYTRCTSNDVIWRDVVLAEITDLVRVQGKKVVVPQNLKSLISAHLTPSTSTSVSVLSPQDQPLPEVIDAKSLENLMSMTNVARRLVSVCVYFSHTTCQEFFFCFVCACFRLIQSSFQGISRLIQSSFKVLSRLLWIIAMVISRVISRYH